MVKGDPIKPQPIVKGICFICNQPCENYCHQECSLAMADERAKRLKEATELTNTLLKQKDGFKRAKNDNRSELE